MKPSEPILIFAIFSDNCGADEPPSLLRTEDGVIFRVEWIRRIRAATLDSTPSQDQLAVDVDAYSEAADLSLTLTLAVPAKADEPTSPDWKALRRDLGPLPSSSSLEPQPSTCQEGSSTMHRSLPLDDPADDAWRRCRCLGCGRPVVKSRDPHRYVGGTSDGARILTWPTGADKAASFGPSLINETCYLLGVVHNDCFDLAVTNIRQGKANHEHELSQLYVEYYPSYQYTLHLPAHDQVCPFCNQRAQLTEEHIWPKWFAKEIRRLGGTILNEDPRRKNSIDITTPVCRSCNNEWLSTLENDAASVMRPMLRGHEVVLNLDRQRLLALWAIKTACLIERKITQVMPRGFMIELAALKQQSDNVYVYLGAYLGGNLVAYGSSRPHYLEGSTDPKAVVVTFSAFKVVFQVLVNLTVGNVLGHTPEFDNDPFLPRLWPVTQSPIIWPPPNLLNEEKLQALPGRIDVSGAPKNP